MSQYPIHKVSQSWADKALMNAEQYQQAYDHAISDSEAFWGEQGKRLDWFAPYTKVKDVSYAAEDLHIKWFYDGVLNVCHNCVDRHLPAKANDVAIIWEGDEPTDDTKLTYAQLHLQVSRFANILKEMGVQKGDVVTLYMPMIVEASLAMLACTRIGAIHSVVFGGFSADALAGRIEDCNSKWIITADEGVRGGKTIPLKASVDDALNKAGTQCVEKVLMVKRTGINVHWQEGRDVEYGEMLKQVADECPCEPMNAEDPMFILYTSGSTGKPKGVLHTTGGYLVYAAYTHEHVFNYTAGDVYWCTADVGWITGHSYMIYGPLANGATTVLFEGVPNYPDVSRMAQVVDKHQINTLYTAPTAIRALMAHGEKAVQGTTRSSLKLLGSVGEPINPEAWEWYFKTIGNSQCPIVDTWWQTETGGILISPLPGATDLKPGSATKPLPGVAAAIVDGEGNILEGACEGNLVMLDSWPGQMRSVYGDHARFVETYFKTFPGKYFSGDGVRRDEDGYFWITGRVDDVLNVSGHRMGTAEIESALVAHKDTAEAAVVGYPHDIKGQGIYAYVILKAGIEATPELEAELKTWVRGEIGAIATPDIIQLTAGLPKTRSGKIMRRILRKIAANEIDTLGDTSTLADPAVVDLLIENRHSTS
ncbi:acetate--CoA ligase [Bermanella sp. WJH001]|mgnify:FL=1|uniref:acetate--CoA ligase n=1 Tax=Bermanella sp. WJH001 TaxID=3048005 RepID=UPI0024BD8EB4|nr:acetate--CoA ligase [Bermanella sp. WJH001]MDJ1537360.1 acetate--CoA ligase [Bermanella sp. WJH001]